MLKAKLPVLIVGSLMLVMTLLLAQNLDKAMGGHHWNESRPAQFRIIDECDCRGVHCQICRNPDVDKSIGGIEFDRVQYKYADNRLVMIAYERDNVDADWCESHRPQLELAFGKACIAENVQSGMHQCSWHTHRTNACFKWHEGHGSSQPPSASLIFSPRNDPE